MSKAYDLTGFLEMLDGNKDQLKMMIEMFVDLTPPLMAEMKEASDNQDWNQAGDLAHKLKSSLRLINATKLVEEALFIEKNGRRNTSTSLLPQKITDLSDQVSSVIEDLKKEF